MKQADSEKKDNSEILAISHQYKDILDHFINNSDPEYMDWMELIEEKICNAFRSESISTNLSKIDYLDKDISDKLLCLAPKIGDSHIRHLCVASPQTEYRKTQKGRKNNW